MTDQRLNEEISPLGQTWPHREWAWKFPPRPKRSQFAELTDAEIARLEAAVRDASGAETGEHR